MAISLREASAGDESFLRAVYASTREQELALVPWSIEQREAFLKFQFDAQHSYYHAQYPNANYSIVLADNQPVGRLYVFREEGEIRILDVALLPEYRNGGIGSSLLRDLLAEGARTGQVVRIWVEEFNPSLALFKRLGFSAIHQDGFNVLMQCVPAKL